MCKPVAATTSQQTLIRDIEMWMLSNMPFGFIFNRLKMVSSFSHHRPYENRWWTRFALWASVCQPLLSHQLKNMTDQEPGWQPPLLGRVVFSPSGHSFCTFQVTDWTRILRAGFNFSTAHGSGSKPTAHSKLSNESAQRDCESLENAPFMLKSSQSQYCNECSL